jgi:glycosyltransferase involved in cell wall biosynthesis
MKALPLISAIVPVYNGDGFLAEAIQSIRRQNYQPLEIIIVDDGSTDKTAEIAAQFDDKVRYIYQSNQGPSAARNHGIILAKGEVIAFLDVDDLWADNVLSDFAGYLVTHPEVEIVQGLIQRMQLETDSAWENSNAFTPKYQPYQFINLGSALYRRSVFDKVGVFDPTLSDNEDTDWFVRAWEQNICKVVMPRVMLFYRKHAYNMTLQQKDLVHFGLMKIYKRRIERARARSSQGLPPLQQSIYLSDYLGQPPD